MNRHVKTITTAIGVYVLFFIAYSFYYDKGLNFWDEGSCPNGVMRVLEGQMPYRDFFSHPMGRFYVFALLFKLFGPSLLIIRTAWLFVTPFLPVMAYFIVRKIASQLASCLAATMVFVSPGVVFNRYISLFVCLNCLAFTQIWFGRRRVGLVLAGCAAGLAGYFRWDVAGFAAITVAVTLGLEMLSAWIWKTQNRNMLSFIKDYIIYIIPILLFATPHLILIIIDEKFRKGIITILVALSNNSYAEMAVPYPRIFSPETARWITNFDMKQLFQLGWFYIVPGMFAAGFLYLVSRFKKPLKPGFKPFFFSLTLFGLLVFNEAYWRSGLGNLAKVSSVAFMLWCFFSDRFRDRLDKRYLRFINAKSRRIVAPTLAFILPLAFTMVVACAYEYPIGSPGVLFVQQHRLELERAKVYAEAYQVKMANSLVRAINDYTTPEEPIFIVPLAPLFYFLSKHPNPTWHEYLLPFDMVGHLRSGEQIQQDIIDELKRNRVRLILYTDFPVTEKTDSRMRDYAPVLFNFIESNYDKRRSIGYFSIYQLRNVYYHFADEKGAEDLVKAEGLFVFDVLPGEEKENLLLQTIPSRLDYNVALKPNTAIACRVQGFRSEDLKDKLHFRYRITLDKGKPVERLLSKAMLVVMENETTPARTIFVELPSHLTGKHTFTFEVDSLNGEPLDDACVGWIDPVLTAFER